MTYSTKKAIRIVAIFGWTILGCFASAEAQVPQDPYPAYGGISQKPFVPAQNRAVQGPMLPNVSSSAVRYEGSSRSERLERIAQDADQHTRKGFELASRGAYYSARAEFVRALRLVAQGLDSDRQCRAYSQALGAGIKALEEVNDFIPTGSQLESDLPLREIIARHQTKVLKHLLTKAPSSAFGQPLLPTPMEAVGAYLKYAQEQLSTAVGGEVAGSMALHGLGKLYATRKGTELDIAVSRAIVCIKTATIVCPQNYLAYNDLGVLLARSGRSADACTAFEKSLFVYPNPTTLTNLASTYRILGKPQKFVEVQNRLAAYQQSMPSKSSLAPSVNWLTPEQFSESYAYTPDAHQLPPARSPNETKAEPAVKQADQSWPWNWLKR